MKIRNVFLKTLLPLLACAGLTARVLAGEQGVDMGAANVEAGWNPLARLQDKGVTFPVSYTGEALGNLSGGYRQGAIYEGLLRAGVQLDLEKLAGESGATFVVSAIYPHGQSLTDGYVHDFNTVSNIDAFDSVRLYETWFEQNFDDGKFSVRAGQLLADCEFFVCKCGSLFLNGAFGAIPLLSKNLSVPVYPVAAPGARIRYAPNDSFYTQFGVFTGDVGDVRTNNRHGTRFDFGSEDGAFLIGEAGWTLNPPPKSCPPDAKGDDAKNQGAPANVPLSGTYKLGGFYHTADFKNLDGVSQHRGDYAFYVIADQEVWHKPGVPDRGLKLFGRIGAAPDDRNTVSFYCEGGLNYQGLVPSRDRDIFGIGVSYTQISANLLDESGSPAPSHHETILEITYQTVINNWLSVQPDFQCVFNPGATASLPTALIAGVRFNISF